MSTTLAFPDDVLQQLATFVEAIVEHDVAVGQTISHEALAKVVPRVAGYVDVPRLAVDGDSDPMTSSPA